MIFRKKGTDDAVKATTDLQCMVMTSMLVVQRIAAEKTRKEGKRVVLTERQWDSSIVFMNLMKW